MVRKGGLVMLCALTLAGAVLLGSCKKKDTEKPTIQIVSPTEANHDVAPGSTLKVIVEVSDNEELGGLKFNIHWAGDHHSHDGHDHDHGAVRVRGEEFKKFEYNESIALSGTKQRVEREIAIPANAKEDPYHLVVFCTDKAGNEQKAFQDIHIEK